MHQDWTRSGQAPPCSRFRRPSRRRAFASSAALLLCAPLAACQGTQSVLNPAANDAGLLATLSIVLFAGGAVILFAVTALLLYAIFAPQERRRWLGQRRTIVAGGLIFPIVTLTAILVYGLVALRFTNEAHGEGGLAVEVTGEQYWWRVRYAADSGAAEFVTANEFVVPVGRPVRIALTSADVIHSFWIPTFAGKVDMIPGRVNQLSFQVEREGIFRGQCAEFCGAQHARMAFDVVALAPEAFEAWRRDQASPARPPATPFLQKGQTLFTQAGCGGCHVVRGTEADGRLGPDLTHVGSRLTIGAGQFPNNVGTLAGWISDTQHLKEGVLMPSYGALAGEDLRALAAYLESLR